ncbi:MAG: two-component regulator propeller domain-containing protein [Bacteroidota bacterium]|nr:two-component regulator propeller domain-containing protein [Bacteroidota bacterium]MDP4204675.1 two-component regulator propeller domain-containing protein [Bacteroidota bacterium]
MDRRFYLYQRWAILLILFVVPYFAHSQYYYKIKYFTTEEGLPQNTVDCIYKDSRGFVWLGTYNGLCRFDGYNFKIYKSSTTGNLIKGNFVHSVCEDRHGNLWVGTSNGLLYYNFALNRFLSFDKAKNGLADNEINTVYCDKRVDIVWVATNAGLNKIIYSPLDDGTMKEFGVWGKYLDRVKVTAIRNTSSGKIYVGTKIGLYTINHNWNGVDPLNEINNQLIPDSRNIYSIYEARNKQLWIGSFYGLFCYTPGQKYIRSYFHNSDDNRTLVHSTVNDIVEDPQGNLLIGTLGGLDIYDRVHDSFYRFPEMKINGYNLNNIFINSLCCDSKGNVWIGTDKGGLNYYNIYQKPFGCLIHDPNNPQGGLSANTINAILENGRSLWIGTAGGGLDRYDYYQRSFAHFKSNPHDPNTISSNYVSALCLDRSGNIWIGTWGGGLNLMPQGAAGKFKRFEHTNVSQSLVSNFVSSIIEDSRGFLVIGTLDGIDVLNLQSKAILHLNNYLPYNNRITGVGCLLKDRMGNYWAGTTNGLFRLPNMQVYNDRIVVTPREITFFPGIESEGLKGNYITTLFEAHNGTIWMGTYGSGINKCERKKDGSYKFTNYSESEGLCNNVVYCMEEDRRGHLWISTDNGLAQFDPYKQKFKNYYRNDGLLSNQFYWSASFKNKDGKMFFGTVGGLNFFYPESMKDYPFAPKVSLVDFKIFNNSIQIGERRHGRRTLLQDISLSDKIKISYKDNVFSFEFSALNQFLSEKCQYAYKMEGVDKDWVVVPSSRRFASYTNLEGGDYVFKVKASNCDGVWSTAPTELHITIIPPFWERLWFKILFLILIVLSVIKYIQYRTRYLQNQKKKLEKLVHERTAKIEEQNEELQVQAEHLLKANQNLELRQQQIEGQKAELEMKNTKILLQRDELVRLNKKVKRINNLRLRFFTNISHEFRTPLTLILGPIESLSKALEHDQNSIKSLNIISRNAQRLLHLMNQLMLFRKIEEGKMELKVTSGNLNDFVETVFHSFDDLASQQQISYTISVDPVKEETWFDEEKFEIILYNLLANAFKYTPVGGKISLKLSYKQEVLEEGKLKPQKVMNLEIADSGIGIRNDDLEHIFDRFYRVSSKENQKIQGTGIGLSLTHELVTALRGKINATSTVGSGTVFRITIPYSKDSFKEDELTAGLTDRQFNLRSQVDQIAREIKSSKEEESLIENTDQKAKPILLIVDDNYDLRSFLYQNFKNDYRVMVAENGREGYEIAQKYIPDLIISDVMMPVMDGLEFCSRVKKNIYTCHVPVILLTAKTFVDNWIEGLESGADDYIPKPFNLKVLQLKVNNLIESRKKFRAIFSREIKPDLEVAASSTLDKQFLAKLYEILERKYSDPDLNLDQLASEMCVSRSLLYKKVKALTDYSVVDFVNLFRLKKSVELLIKKEKSISEIAILSGFSDPKYYSRIFKKVYGTSPKDYVSE